MPYSSRARGCESRFLVIEVTDQPQGLRGGAPLAIPDAGFAVWLAAREPKEVMPVDI
jgi:hypothetical protein